MKVRECMEKEIAPIMTKYWENAECFNLKSFQKMQLCTSLAALSRCFKDLDKYLSPVVSMRNLLTFWLRGYGCPGHSITGSAIAAAEVARVDATQMLEILLLIHFELVNPVLQVPNHWSQVWYLMFRILSAVIGMLY